MTSIPNKKNGGRGYSLVEMLIYIAILTLFSVTIINVILSFSSSYRTLLALRMVDSTGIDAMERITRDIRSASSIVTGQSTLGSNPGVLTLLATANGVSTTSKFYIQNNTLKVDVNGVYLGPISGSNTSVTSLIFRSLSTGISSAVKVEMTVQSTV